MRAAARHRPALAITLQPVADPPSLELLWRELETRSQGSFFQSWTWVGCLAAERFDDAVLLEARRDGLVVALGLCNRLATRRWDTTLWFNESGRPVTDSVFVEHSGPLLAEDQPALLAACVAALLERKVAAGGRASRVVLSGVGDAVRAAASALGSVCHVRQSRPAPFVDLSQSPASYLAGLGRSTRYQLGRSRRSYEAIGPLRCMRATTVPEGLRFLDRLMALHQTSWTRRGQPGAFAADDVVRFHQALITTGLPRGEIDILRVQAAEQDVGYLYNFVWRGRVYAYQSGFDYAVGPHHKPGLTCHHLAIETYRAGGALVYDFLAGASRYKSSLGSGEQALHWLELVRPWSARGVAVGLIKRLRTSLHSSGTS